jgi:serine/threonine-protein kinase
MLTAIVPFKGETVSDTLAGILEHEPNWQALPPTTPANILVLLRRCLQKDPDERLRDIWDARIEVKEALTEPITPSLIGVGSVAQPPLWRRAIPWSITVVSVAVVAGAIWSLTRPVSRPITRFLITPESTVPLANVVGNDVAVSPDGSNIVYLASSGAGTQLYVRRLDEITTRPIAGTEGSFGQPFFSPDGGSVAFFTFDQLKRVSLLGGGAMSVCNTVLGGVSGSWGPGGMIVFSDASYSLYRVSVAGGEPQILAVPDKEKGEIYYRHPEILPGGEAVLFTVWGNGAFQTRVLSLETGDQKIVIEGGRQAHYLPTGYLVYERAGNLTTVPFDLERLEISGNAVPVLEGVRQHNFAADYALSTNGTLVYVSSTGGQWSLVWVDRDGTHQPLMESETDLQQPRLSPDGERVAFQSRGVDGVGDIWIYEVRRGTLAPLTFGESSAWPIWTLDGKQITFGQLAAGVFSIPADGSGEASQLTTTTVDRTSHVPGSWSPDGVLAYSEGVSASHDIYVLTLEGKGKAEPFMVTEFNEKHPVFSPDGRWIAFTSDRSGRYEVYVKPYPGEGGIMPISTGGGSEPMWAQSGKELFYRSGQKMMVASVETQPTFKAETPRLLFEGYYDGTWFDLTSDYDISPDGQRFLMIKWQTEETSTPTQLIIVQNWFEELKRLVPTGERLIMLTHFVFLRMIDYWSCCKGFQ